MLATIGQRQQPSHPQYRLTRINRMKTSLFDYHLPRERIAQFPITPRDHSRLLVYNKKSKKLIHDHFYNLGDYLQPDDVLVFNDTKVFSARLFGRKETGGLMEVFLLRPLTGNTWEVLIGGKVRRVGLNIGFTKGLKCEVTKKLPDGIWQARFNKSPKQVLQIANQIGTTPIPPYIKKLAKLKDYQTIYAKKVGSVAAPTAGFHFTKKLLAQLKKKGIRFEYITLHVGFGTFQPVKVDNIEQHTIHSEYAEVDAATVKKLIQAKKDGRRIIAVGTTTVRTLEFFFNKKSQKKSGWINTFIYPGYRFKFIDTIITNFHLPKSSLLMLVSAFAGRQQVLNIYKKAVQKKYRFYSFGDGMLLM
jgi:S-adenosylmethionine:tRNA ribosyltransferase-isomerase